MAFVRYKQRGQKWYAYEVSNIWNKELKKYKQHTDYLGVAEENGGPYKKAEKSVAPREKAILDYGDSYALDKILETSGLKQLLKDCFVDHDQIMALVLYQLTQGQAMSHYHNWAEGNIVQQIFKAPSLTSQRISDLLKKLGKAEVQRKFFQSYIATFFKDKHGVLIDSTALPSAINSSLNAWGYGAGGVDKKVGCLMLVDKNSKLPIFFRSIPGEIADVSTLEATFKEIKLLGLKAEHAIFDAGYFSESNITYLCQTKINFISRMPKSRKAFVELVTKYKRNLEDMNNALQYGDRVVFMKSVKIKLYGYKMFAHIILDPDKKAKDMKYLMLDALNNPAEKDGVQEKIDQAGMLILISSSELDKTEVLPSYYARQSIEQIFGFAKSSNDLLPLRVHSELGINGYLLLSFIALVLFILVRQKLSEQFTVEQALLILRNLKAKVFDHSIIIAEASKKQKTILSLLGCTVPTNPGI